MQLVAHPVERLRVSIPWSGKRSLRLVMKSFQHHSLPTIDLSKPVVKKLQVKGYEPRCEKTGLWGF